MIQGRTRRKLGDHFGLSNFGVNFTELAPGAMSALQHHHLTQDEFIYVVSGTPTLVLGDEEYVMQPGDCFGFKKGEGIGHQLVNRSSEPVAYLEIGDRAGGDQVDYPGHDLRAQFNADGSWSFLHKDGTPY
ncbi:MAG: cupin domain-containing protein [Gammaproteobacteria bacterium]|nr:cupin domain-containing protein [Gammaproteobacteria bacterium]